VVAHLQIAEAYESSGNLDAAEAELRSTLELLRRERDEDDPQLAHVLFRLAQVETAAGNPREAEGLYSEVVAAYGVNGQADAELSLARANLAAARASGGDLAGASELLAEAVPALHEKLGADDERVIRAAAGWASIHDQLGRAEHAEGHHGEAVAHYRRSVAIREQWGDAANPQMAVTLHSLGVLNHTSQNFADAEAAYLRALEIVGHDDDRAGRLLHDLGLVYATQGEFERAEPAFRESLAMLERSLGADDPTVKRARDDLAQVRGVLTQMREAAAQPAAGMPQP
jgi:tetratricopeptide (TPR) repeat protein